MASVFICIFYCIELKMRDFSGKVNGLNVMNVLMSLLAFDFFSIA